MGMLSICFDAIKFSKLIEGHGLKPQKRIKNSGEYFAHTPPNNRGGEKESLVSHMEKVKEAFLELVDLHGLDEIVDKHINVLVSHNEINDRQNFYAFLKLLFFEAIHFHDIGKLNENYQIDKMGLVDHFEKRNNSIGTTHSNLSAFLFIAYMLEKLDMLQTDTEKGFAFIFILLFSMPIRKHHASDLTNPFYYFENAHNEAKNHFFETVKVDDLKKYLDKINIEFDKTFHHDIFYGLNLNENYKKPFFTNYLEKINSFPFYSLLKLNSSLLTISDYVATARYMWNEELESGGIINKELRENVYDNFYSTHNYNEILNSKSPKKLSNLNKRSKENLNELRFKMTYEVRENLLQDKNINKNLFFLEAPTGGGKTNMSFMAVAELLKNRLDLNKVFYVFPFTTLVTQTQKSIVETFNLEPEDYIELHSKTGFKENEDTDGEYGNKKKNFIDYQFMNYPFTLLTHIKFFDIIKSHKKNDNYLYHKLANSIVIIDELQAYSPEHWDKIYYFMKNISELFNTVFIVMSATLPKIDELVISERLDFSQFVHLIQNKKRYFQNANFANRVEFESMIPENCKNSIDEIKDKLFEESEKYAENNDGRCWTLIEFIFKNSAADFYEKIESEVTSKGYEVKMLSGTILEPVRKSIINDLKERTESNEKSKIILVSTQVVEAGVDLDFDIGFKDTSILDSDEQLAGRINRNTSKNGCKVFLFNYNDEYRVYGSDYRYKMQKQELDKNNYKDILKNKDFDAFYKKTFNFINELNKSESRYGFFDYESLVRKLSYSAVHNEFKLIDQDTLSVFVNVEFDLVKYPIEHTLGLEKSGKINGKDVFEKYCAIVENKDQDFINRKISLTEIQGLMSNFIFSTYKSKKMIEKLFPFSGEEKYGFWYISDLVNSSQKEIYTLESGLNEKELEDVQFI